MSRQKSKNPAMLMVLGVHRSGTSVVARMLECLGAAPSKNLLEPLPNNPKGFFEDFDVQRFNEYELLPALGAHWHDLASPDWSRLSPESRAELLEKAVGILGRNFSRDNPLSVLKDPRLGILLPFWLEALETAGYAVKAVCAVRDPLSVARSLQARDGFSITRGAMLFASDWLAALPHLEKIPTAILGFDAIFEEARGLLERLAGQLGIPLPQDFEARVEEFVLNHLDPSLRHSRFAETELSSDDRIPSMALDVYRLLAAAEKSGSLPREEVIELSTRHGENRALLRDCDRLFVAHAELRQTQINLENEVGGLRSHLEKTVEERDARYTVLEEEISKRDAIRSAQQAELAAKDREILELSKKREDQTRRLGELLIELSEKTSLASRLQSESAASESERSSLLARNTELENALLEKSSEVSRLEEQFEALKAEVALLTDNNGTLEKSLASALRDRTRLEEEMARLELDLRDSRGKLETREAQVQGLKLEIDATRASTVWRLTAPLRRVVDAIKKSSFGLAKAKQEILESGLFDPVFYSLQYPDLRGSGNDLLRQYLLHGGFQGRNPSPLFHSRFYLDHNPDARVAGINPLLHYIRVGRAQGRIPKQDQSLPISPPEFETTVAREIRIIRESGLFDATWYFEKNPDVRHDGMEPVEHYVWHGWKEGRDPSPFFDSRFYLRTYLDSGSGGINPLAHYIETGRAKGHFPSEAHRAEARRMRENSFWKQTRSGLGAPLEFYNVLVARYGGPLPTLSRFFRKLVSGGPTGIFANFHEHFRFAKKLVDAKNRFESGENQRPKSGAGGVALPPRESLPDSGSILFIGCDGFLAGSQIVLLNILKWLHAHTSLRLKTVLIAGGELVPEYSKYGSVIVWQELAMQIPDPKKRLAHLSDFLGHIDLVYGNTIVASTIYEELKFLNAPFLSHIHELEQSIRAYVRPETLRSLEELTVEYIACSPPVAANLVENHGAAPAAVHTVNAFIENRTQDSGARKDVLRRKFGLREDEFLVVGCGTIYWRKGPDLFVDTAIALKESGAKNFRFLWLGDHYWDFDPQSRALVPWKTIDAKIKKHGLENFIEFPGVKPDARDYFQAADVFYLPSREDPFPLVCLEAAQCGTPVVCFDQAGGMPDFVESDAGIVVPHLDVPAAAAALKKLRDDPALRRQLGKTAAAKLALLHTDDIAVPEILGVCRDLMKTAPLVSVIVPVYNHGRFLAQRIESILAQSFRDFEILILDDASTDDSLEVARRYEGHPQVRILANEQNSGSAFRQWKKGIEQARGQFVWIAEGDDSCEPDFLGQLLPFFRDPEVALAYSDSMAIDEKGDPIESYAAYYAPLDSTHWKMDHLVPGEAEMCFGLGVKNTIPNASAAVFRKQFVDSSILESIASMRFSGDWFFHVQLVKGRKIGFRSLPLNLHRRHDASVTRSFNSETDRRPSLLDEARQVHEFVLANYTLTPSFRRKLEFYLREQIGALFPGSTTSDYDKHYPFSRTLEAVDRGLTESRSLKKRFVFITTGDSSHDGGSEQLWIQTALRLARDGHSVMAVIKRWSPEPYFFAAFREAGIEFAFKDRDPVKAIAGFAPDLVVINIGDQDEGIEWYTACRTRGLRYTIVNHLTKEPKYWPIRHELQDEVREGNLRAAQVLFTSQNNRALLEKRLGCVIPHAGIFHNPLYIDRSRRLLFPPMDGPIRLAMPSRLLNIHKGQNIALEVFAMKKWRARNIQLHLYGNGPDESSLRAMVEREGLANVFFHDPEWQLPKPDMESIWRDNHALLMTSFMEGMPLVLLNAMFYERVPIVTDIGGHREVVRDGESGFLAAEPAADAVDAALEAAWQRLGDWENIGRRAREGMLRFAPEDPIADLMEKLMPFAGRMRI